MSAPAARARAVVLMGVSGSGKTTVGRSLARALGWELLDADDLHPAANVAKMSAGLPLDESDRAPWLAAVRAAIDRLLAADRSAVVACSALRRAHRERLARGGRVRFVYLRGDEATLRRRLAGRHGHFADARLLASQLASLEEPAADEGIASVSIDASPDEIAAAIRDRLRL